MGSNTNKKIYYEGEWIKSEKNSLCSLFISGWILIFVRVGVYTPAIKN